MKREYKVKWDPPADYDPSSVLRKLPSPIAPGPREIYNYFVQPDGFYFVDRLVDPAIAGLAFKMFVDEALEYASEVSIVELKQERAVESEDPGGRTSMKFQDVELAFEFVNAGQPMEHTAYVSRSTGEVFWQSEAAGVDELPEDLDVSDDYVEIPHAHDLDLGTPLVWEFISERAPQLEDEVRRAFSRKGAYSRYKGLLERHRLLESWYEFEARRTREALLDWCRANDLPIELDD